MSFFGNKFEEVHMTILLTFVALVGTFLACWAIRTMLREDLFPNQHDWAIQVFGLGTPGGLMMFVVGTYLHQTGPPSIGGYLVVDSFLYIVGILTLLLSLISGLVATKLAFWVDNHRWPTDEEWKEEMSR